MSKEVLDRIEALDNAVEARAVSEAARLTAVEAKIAEVGEQSERAAAAMTEMTEKINKNRMSLGIDAKDAKKFSLSRAIAGFLVHRNPEKYCPFEWDLHKQLLSRCGQGVETRVQADLDAEYGGRKMVPDGMLDRTMTTLTGAGGAFLIEDEIFATIYETQRAKSLRAQLGVTMIRPTGFPVRVNKITSNTTAYRRGEGASVSASDIAFGQMTLSPKSVAARGVISQENLMFPSTAIDTILENNLLTSIDLKQDLDFFTGNGSSSAPIGILNTTGVTDQASNSGTGHAPTYQLVGIDLPFALENNNALVDDGSLKYVGVPGHIKLLRQEKNTVTTSGSTEYIIPPWARPTAADFFPYPLLTTTQLVALGADAGASPLLFGRWSDTFHATFGGAMVKRSDVATDGTYNGLTEGWTHIVLTTWDDVGVIRPSSIVYDNDLDHA